MKAYVVMEHLDGSGATPPDMAELVHAIFLSKERALDFISGMASYVNSYEAHRLFVVDDHAEDPNHVCHFQIVEKEIL